MSSEIKSILEVSRGLSLSFAIESRRSVLTATLKSLDKILSNFITGSNHRLLLLAIDEILQNSYEHGNLGISGDEKQVLQANNQFDAELTTRELTYGNKLIKLNLELTNNHLSFSAEDEGQGFMTSIINKTQLGVSDKLNGRGLAIIKATADTIHYNDSGNKITIKKNYP